jgi:hypothetical protein
MEDKAYHIQHFQDFLAWEQFAKPTKEKPSAKISKPKESNKQKTKGNKTQTIKRAPK